MKLVPKLTVALLIGTCGILAVNGYRRVRREVAFFEDDRRRSHEMIGRSLGAAVTAIWKSEGRQSAMTTIDAVNKHFDKIRIRWVEPSGDASMDPISLAHAPAGEPLTRVIAGADARWYTYVPIDADGARRGYIELSESATSEHRFAQSTVVDTIATAAALALLSAILSFAMGQWLVGSPVRVLGEKARRIGRGDFGGPVVLARNDELSELALEINRMCDRLATTLEQLRHADRLATVGKLASGIAHELGTPLNVVSARAQMIARGETTPAESVEYAGVIANAAERMTKIIRQLLQFARRKASQKAPRDLRELTRESLELLRPLAEKRRVAFAIAPGGETPNAQVDAGELQQVITNLVMNAIQAMPKGGKIAIEVRTETRQPPADIGGPPKEYLCLRVADEGDGIAPADLPHVFEPFFTTKDVGEGTGLGLAVSYEIVREHGGFIDVTSEVGKGSVFSVFLPPSAAS